MLIRREQVETFEKAAWISFENEMVQYMLEFAPRLAAVAGEGNVRRLVRIGLERAKGYMLSLRGPMRFYLELMASSGSDFDSDPVLPWARAGLTDETIPDELERADRLYRRMLAYNEAVGGKENEFGKQALQRMLRANPEEFTASRGSLEEKTVKALELMYPQKAEGAGKDALVLLVQRAREKAQRYAIKSQEGTAFLTGLMFAFGHGVDTDPMYPWVSSALTDPLIIDEAGRVKRLYDRTRVYAQRTLEQLEKPASS